MKITEFSVKNFQLTIVVFVMVAAMGVSAFFSIPRSEDPVFPIPNFAVIAVYPGASPSDIEQLVVDPIEDKINELDELKSIKTEAGDGVAVITIEFDAYSDAEKKYDEVLREINALRPDLPAELFSLDVQKFSSANVKIVQAALVSETAPYRELDDLAEKLKEKIETVAGVKDVKTHAFPKRELRVSLDLEKLSQLRLPPTQAIGVIQGGNANIPGGSVEAGARKFNVKTSGNFQSVEEVRNTVVSAAAGHIVYLRDVAEVDWNTEDETYLGRFNGKRAVFITATMKERQNIFTVRDGIYEQVDAFGKTLPQTIRIEHGFDQSKNVMKRLSGLGFDFVLAILLVLLTLLPLGFRVAAIVMVSIPLSLAIGLSLLNFTGFSINQLSIVGFVVALGLLVDDSIVVAENISRYLRMGYSPRAAAIEATKQIGVAVLGCTATLILAFVPILALPGTAGQFIRSLPIAVIYTVFASLLVSLTIIPFLSSLILKPSADEHGNVFLRTLTHGIETAYRPVLAWSLARPLTTVIGAAAIFVLSLGLIPVIGFSLFPKAGTPQFLITIETPDGTSLQATDNAVRDVELALAQRTEIKQYLSNIGKGNPQIYYNVTPGSEQTNIAEVFVEAHPLAPADMTRLVDELREAFNAYPGAKIEVKEFENGPPLDAPVALRLIGEDLDTLKNFAATVEQLVAGTSGTIYVNNPVRVSKTDLKVNVNADKAGLLGVQQVEIDRTVRLALAGISAGKFREADGDEYTINVRLPKGRAHTVESLDKIYVASVTGVQVPLAQLATVGFKASPTVIQHYNKERSVTITSYVATGYNTDKVTKEILAKLDALPLPPAYRIVPAGEIETRQESFGGMGTAILIATFGILAVLVLEFKTFKSTLIVASVIPLGIIGGIVILFLTGNTLSFTATIGFIALIGIEIKNSILLVDFTNQLREQGAGLDDAIQKAGEIRFLPILLTTLTAIGGLIPIALAGSALYSPLAWVIIGGLISSTLLSRLVTPVMYKLLPPQMETQQAESPVKPPPMQVGLS